MLEITIPLWLMLTAAGVPTLSLSLLIFRLLRIKRRKHARSTVSTQPVELRRPIEDFNGRIHQEILDQQIDAVFNALATVLETERLKLKALVGHSLSSPGGPAIPQRLSPTQPEPRLPARNDETAREELSVGQQVLALSQEGMAAAEIARQLGLSQAEIALALKMSARRNGAVGAKVQAVA